MTRFLCDDEEHVDYHDDDDEDDHDDEDETDKIITCLTETWVLKGSQILFGTNLVRSSFCAENFFILCPEAIVM